jgi:hypothetical protein
MLAAALLIAYLVARPSHLPSVSHYVQLTRDGQQKALIGTDGARLYLSLGEVRT